MCVEHCLILSLGSSSSSSSSNNNNNNNIQSCRATRLGREHHDDLAQFMLGMGYATEALHLPGISKR
jgi:hypothetical protein